MSFFTVRLILEKEIDNGSEFMERVVLKRSGQEGLHIKLDLIRKKYAARLYCYDCITTTCIKIYRLNK